MARKRLRASLFKAPPGSIPAKGSRVTNGASTASAPARARPITSPTCGARATPSSIPPPLQKATAEQNWTAIDIERAFIAANNRLRPGMIGVACARGALQEVRICFSKDLRDFHACPEVARRGCPFRAGFRAGAAVTLESAP